MKRTEKSKANSRQKSKANKRQKSKANSRQSKPKDCDRDKAKYEEKPSTEESCSQPVPKHPRTDADVQQEQHDLKLGEVITTIPTIDFNEETVENKNANHPDSSEAATQKVQTCVIRDREDGDAFFKLESRGSMKSAQQLKTAAVSFFEQKTSTAIKEDLNQNTTDIPVVMQRQVRVTQKSQITVDVPLLQYMDTTFDVPAAKQR